MKREGSESKERSSVLEASVSFSYGDRKVLDGVELEARKGELLAIIGPNGAGKSTLLKCLVGILKPQGYVRLNGRDILGMSPKVRARYVAYVPQSSVPEYNFTIEEFVEMGAYMTKGDVTTALKRVGLYERRRDSIFNLSGGEYQLVLVARALAQGSEVILLDEPTSHLDVNHAFRVMETLMSLRSEKIVLSVLHDLALAVRYADRIIVLKDGRKFWEGRGTELTSNVITQVYGVRATIIETELGRTLVASP